MATYEFTFPAAAAELPLTVTNRAGVTVATDTLGTATGDFVAYETDLPYGDSYEAFAAEDGSNTYYRATTNHVDTGGGGGVGASETAYFVATGPADVTDGNGAAGNLNFIADDRHDALPDWVSLSSGDVVLSSDAGTCAWAFTGLFDFDFSATTPPDSEGAILSAFQAVNPVGTTTISADAAGDGQDAQTGPTARAGGITLPGTFTVASLPIAFSDDQITTIPDGTATPRVALTITRIAQAAVLPDPA